MPLEAQIVEQIAPAAVLGEQHHLAHILRTVADYADDVGMGADRLHDLHLAPKLEDVFHPWTFLAGGMEKMSEKERERQRERDREREREREREKERKTSINQ